MDKYTVVSLVVKKNVGSCWDVKDVSPCEIFLLDRDEAHYKLRKTHIVYLLFGWVYHVIVLDGEWIHGTCQGK